MDWYLRCGVVKVLSISGVQQPAAISRIIDDDLTLRCQVLAPKSESVQAAWQ